MSDNSNNNGFDVDDFTRRLKSVIEESEAVKDRLQSVISGADSALISGVIGQGLQDYGLMFKGLLSIHEKSISRILRIQDIPDKVPMDRITNALQLQMPEDPLELIKRTFIMEYIEVNFSASNKFVELLTNGSLILLVAQVQSISKANGIILDIGDRKFTPLGYFEVLMADIGGVFLPIVSQLLYITDTLFRSEQAKLEEAEREASTVGKAFRFSEYTALANDTIKAYDNVFESAEFLLNDFVTIKLPQALDELSI